MKIRFGYVCISKTLDNITASSTMTFSNFSKLEKDEAYLKLDRIINSNFDDLEKILEYNIKNEISFYRLTSNLIPLLTHDEVFVDLKKYKKRFKKIGNIIKENNLRVDTHPDQYCVLNSVNENVIINSIKILSVQQEIYELMGFDGKMILHIGSSVFGKKPSITRFINNFKKLDKNIKNKIILENDDKVFDIEDTLLLCEELKIPMVLDYHHHVCNNPNNIDIKDYIKRILKTWENESLPPKIHLSSSKTKKEFRSHNDYINVEDCISLLNILKTEEKDIDIMVEAKMKDDAIFRLFRYLKYLNYNFINQTTISLNNY